MTQRTSQTQDAKSRTTAWTLDTAHSSAEFTVRHMMIANVRGRIPIRSGTIVLEGERPSRVEADLDLAGIDTGAADRDNHLRSADFFDVENHPTLTFRSTGIEQLDDETYRVTGDLAIRGTAREVTFDAVRTPEQRDPWGKTRVGIEAELTLDRKQWDLTWNVALEAGGFLVGDKVKVALQLQAVRDE